MVIAQQPPSQGVLFCLYEQAQQAVLSLVSVFGVARIVVVAEYGDHALGRTAQQVGVGKDLLGTDVLHVTREDHQVGVLPGDAEGLSGIFVDEQSLVISRQRQPGLRGAAVVARERQGNDAFLAAFLLGEPEAVDLAELKQALRRLMMYQRLYLARKSSRQIKKLLTARML